MSSLSLRATIQPLAPITSRMKPASIHRIEQTLLGARFTQRLQARTDKTTEEEAPPSPSSTSEGEKDFWEGEQWNGLGSVASVALPALVVLAVVVGFFAAQTYNQDATVFMENARSDEDRARLYTFD